MFHYEEPFTSHTKHISRIAISPLCYIPQIRNNLSHNDTYKLVLYYCSTALHLLLQDSTTAIPHYQAASNISLKR